MMRFLMLGIILIITATQVQAQALNAFILQYHGAGCDNQSGKLAVVASGGTSPYTYVWSNGSTIDTAYNLGAGTHWVMVYSGTDSILKSVTLEPWGIDSILITHACEGGLGSIFLDNINAQFPIQYTWYRNDTLMPVNNAYVNNLTPGNYQYIITDAEGCIDSGFVAILASSPVLLAYAADSSLCYGQSSQVWYTPGFTLYDNWGITYNSTTDTIVAQNYMNSITYPTYGVDSLGCSASLISGPFVYLQSHPDPVPLYNFGDTISVPFVINLNPSVDLIYTWYFNSVEIASGPYSYIPVDSAGTYAVSITNIYGCVNFGSIQATASGLNNMNNQHPILIMPNPTNIGSYWNIKTDGAFIGSKAVLFDVLGNEIIRQNINSYNIIIDAPQKQGIYFLKIADQVVKLQCN